MADYIAASYAGVDLLISTLSTSVGRDVIVQSPARGDKHVLQDRGLKVKSTQATVLFCDQPGKPHYLVRADQFRQAAELEDASVFSHPILGTYNARITGVELQANEDLAVTFTCTIIAEEEPQVVFQSSAGVSVAAGVEAVGTAATTATDRITAADLEPVSPVPATCASTVAAWGAVDPDELDSQQVFLEVASLVGQIDNDIATYELESDLSLWLVYQAYILLRYQVVRAAESATSTANDVFDLLVAQPRPLLAICADIYGAADAEDAWAQVTKLNRIRTPGLVPAGTTLKMPSPEAA